MNKNSRSFRRDPSLMAGRIKRYEKKLRGLFEGARTELEAMVDPTSKALAAELAGVDLDMKLTRLRMDAIIEKEITAPAENIINDEVQASYRYGGIRADQFLGVKDDNPYRMILTDRRAVSALTARSLSGLKGISDEMSKSIMSELTDGILKGLSPRETARNISKKVDDIGINRAKTLARTETMKAFNTGTKERYKQRGYDKVEWCAATSERTCMDCMAQDGRTYDIEDAPDCPLHPNCRCTLLPVLPELEA